MTFRLLCSCCALPVTPCSLSLVICCNKTLLKLQTVLFLFLFQILHFQIEGVAYTQTFTVNVLASSVGFNLLCERANSSSLLDLRLLHEWFFVAVRSIKYFNTSQLMALKSEVRTLKQLPELSRYPMKISMHWSDV